MQRYRKAVWSSKRPMCLGGLRTDDWFRPIAIPRWPKDVR